MLYMKIKCKKHTTTTKTTATTKTNNAEHDNLYNRVNAYKSQKKTFWRCVLNLVIVHSRTMLMM